jgi:hypothetical protein
MLRGIEVSQERHPDALDGRRAEPRRRPPALPRDLTTESRQPDQLRPDPVGVVESGQHPPAHEEGRNRAGLLAQRGGHLDIAPDMRAIGRQLVGPELDPGLLLAQLSRKSRAAAMRTGLGPEDVERNPDFAPGIGHRPIRGLIGKRIGRWIGGCCNDEGGGRHERGED